MENRKLERQVGDAKDIIDNLVAEIEQLEGEKEVLQERVDILESENEKLEECIQDLQDKIAG